MNGQPFDITKVDPRLVGIVIGLCIVAGVVVVGDQVAFMRPPRNAFENLTAIVPMLAYMVTSDRTTANISAGVLYASVLGVVVIFGWNALLQKVIEPMQIKKMIDAKRREKTLINRYGDDTM